MAYNEVPVYSTSISTGNYPTGATIRPQPQSPDALSDLGQASQVYAECAASFIAARDNLNDARTRWQECRDVVAKTQEAEGV